MYFVYMPSANPMRLRPQLSHLPVFLAILAITAAIFVGLSLRLDDPLETHALPAEDPYTHTAFVREHLRDGDLDPLYEDGSVYPPGMHAFIAAVWSYTGISLMSIMRLGPALFGAVGILGMALLLWRHTSPTGAMVGAWAYAVAPEVIFRTTMMAPTAMDLAIIPFLLYALLELAQGKGAWFFVVAPVTAFFVFAHPWFLLLLGLVGLIFLVLSFLMPWSGEHRSPLTPIGTAGLIAIFGVAGAVVLMRGAAGSLAIPSRLPLVEYAPMILAASLLPLLLVLVFPKFSRRIFPWWGRSRAAPWVAIGVTLILVALLSYATRLALSIGLPEHVRLQGMVGWPILLIAVAGLVALPFLRGPLAVLGAAFFLGTYPFVIFNVFHSDFWPHRTAVFLAVALVVLAGVAAWGAELAVRWTLETIARRRARSRPAREHAPTHAGGRTVAHRVQTADLQPRLRHAMGAQASSSWVFLLPFLLIALPLTGALSTGTPEPYDGWYRLYDDCDHKVLEDVAAFANMDEEAIVITGSWQSKTVIAAFTDDSARVWFAGHFYLDEAGRDGLLEWPRHNPFPLYVVVDHYTMDEFGVENLSFLKTPEWRPVTWGCSDDGVGGVGLFRFQPTA